MRSQHRLATCPETTRALSVAACASGAWGRRRACRREAPARTGDERRFSTGLGRPPAATPPSVPPQARVETGIKASKRAHLCAGPTTRPADRPRAPPTCGRAPAIRAAAGEHRCVWEWPVERMGAGRTARTAVLACANTVSSVRRTAGLGPQAASRTRSSCACDGKRATRLVNGASVAADLVCLHGRPSSD